jgi:hypothetical protein
MRIFISNLASTTTAHELRQLFAPYGVVDGGYILHERETRQAQRCSGCGRRQPAPADRSWRHPTRAQRDAPRAAAPPTAGL